MPLIVVADGARLFAELFDAEPQPRVADTWRAGNSNPTRRVPLRLLEHPAGTGAIPNPSQSTSDIQAPSTALREADKSSSLTPSLAPSRR